MRANVYRLSIVSGTQELNLAVESKETCIYIVVLLTPLTALEFNLSF